MTGNRWRQLGDAGVLGGVAVFAYVLLKEWWLPAYGGPPPFGDGSGIAFHMLETVPMALLAAGTLGAWAWLRAGGRDRAADGALLATVGASGAAVAHAIEHLLFVLFQSSIGYVFMALFYLGWLAVAVGLTVVGVRGATPGGLGTRERALLVAVVPAGIVVAVLLGTFWFRAYADGFKLVVGVAVATLGYRVGRSAPEEETAPEFETSNASR